MSRQKSVVLTPAEKKLRVAELKAELKAAKDAAKTIAQEKKVQEKSFNAFLKDVTKRAAAADKQVAAITAALAEFAPAKVA